MLSDNIRNNRKRLNLSQDELAEKLGVSRQSISFWETGQTQPTIENIIALTKVFNISSDMLLGNGEGTAPSQVSAPKNPEPKKNKVGLVLVICLTVIGIVICITGAIWFFSDKNGGDDIPEGSTVSQTESSAGETDKVLQTSDAAPGTDSSHGSGTPGGNVSGEESFDLFAYCKGFAIEIGTLNGDYCIYQQPSERYGGYEGEYFSISYWADSDMVEFCLHCPLDETLSHNFYLRMRGGYNGTYEYVSSKYYRDSGESLREAMGYIDPAVFSDGYPIGCDKYIGDFEGQDQFMEDTRVGMCDLIRCLKQFAAVEGMKCDFSDFEFKHF